MAANETLIRIKELCIKIFAYSRIGDEVDISGNGVNSSEAHKVAWGIMDIISEDGNGRNWEKQNEELISEDVKMLKKIHGLD